MIVSRGDASIMLLELTLPQETLRLSTHPHEGYDARIMPGGIAEITSFVALDSTNVPGGELAVTVSDKGGRLESLLEGANECRRSVVKLDRYTPAATVRRFTGILNSWAFDVDTPETVTLSLRVDDSTLMNSWAPHVPVLKSEWGEGSYVMPDGVSGIFAPYLYGTHDSSGVTGTGFVPLVCVGRTGATGRYLVCLGRAKTKIGTWTAAGAPIAGTLQYVSRGGKSFTTVNYTSGITAGLEIRGDFTGYEDTGDGTGALITNPVSQLRHMLNMVYANWRSGNWPTTNVAPIDATSWAACAAWCDTYKLEGSAYVGGTADKVAVKQVVERWLASFPLFKLCWNAEGKLVMVNLAQAIVWPGYPTTASRRVDAVAGQTARRTQVAMDVTALARQVSGTHCYSAVEDKGYSTLDVQDPAVIEQVTSSNLMDWSLSSAI